MDKDQDQDQDQDLLQYMYLFGILPALECGILGPQICSDVSCRPIFLKVKSYEIKR